MAHDIPDAIYRPLPVALQRVAEDSFGIHRFVQVADVPASTVWGAGAGEVVVPALAMLPDFATGSISIRWKAGEPTEIVADLKRTSLDPDLKLFWSLTGRYQGFEFGKPKRPTIRTAFADGTLYPDQPPGPEESS